MTHKFTEGRTSVINDLLRLIVTSMAINEHRRTWRIPKSMLEDAAWREMEISWTTELDHYVVTVKRKGKLSDGIEEAEFEIVEDPTMKPGTWKLLPRRAEP